MEQAEDNKYWSDTRRPLSCLLFLLRWVMIYEFGAARFADPSTTNVRNRADSWLRSMLPDPGVGQVLLLPLLLLVILLGWHIVRRHPWRIRVEAQTRYAG